MSVVVRSVSLMTTTATQTPAELVAVALEAIRRFEQHRARLGLGAGLLDEDSICAGCDEHA